MCLKHMSIQEGLNYFEEVFEIEEPASWYKQDCKYYLIYGVQVEEFPNKYRLERDLHEIGLHLARIKKNAIEEQKSYTAYCDKDEENIVSLVTFKDDSKWVYFSHKIPYSQLN